MWYVDVAEKVAEEKYYGKRGLCTHTHTHTQAASASSVHEAGSCGVAFAFVAVSIVAGVAIFSILAGNGVALKLLKPVHQRLVARFVLDGRRLAPFLFDVVARPLNVPVEAWS